MNKGTKVSWQIANGQARGNGITITDEDSDENILVAVNALGLHNGEDMGYHPVIWCSVSWLTVITDSVPDVPSVPSTNTPTDADKSNTQFAASQSPVNTLLPTN